MWFYMFLWFDVLHTPPPHPTLNLRCFADFLFMMCCFCSYSVASSTFAFVALIKGPFSLQLFFCNVVDNVLLQLSQIFLVLDGCFCDS